MFFDFNTIEIGYKLRFLNDIRECIWWGFTGIIWIGGKIFLIFSERPFEDIELCFEDEFRESDHLKSKSL